MIWHNVMYLNGGEGALENKGIQWVIKLLSRHTGHIGRIGSFGIFACFLAIVRMDPSLVLFINLDCRMAQCIVHLLHHSKI